MHRRRLFRDLGATCLPKFRTAIWFVQFKMLILVLVKLILLLVVGLMVVVIEIV